MANLLMLIDLVSADKCHPVHIEMHDATPAPPNSGHGNSKNINRRAGKLQRHVTGSAKVKGPAFTYKPVYLKHSEPFCALKAYLAAQADTRLHVTPMNSRYIEPVEYTPFPLYLSLSYIYLFLFVQLCKPFTSKAFNCTSVVFRPCAGLCILCSHLYQPNFKKGVLPCHQ